MKQPAFRAPSAESKNTAPVAISTVKKSQPNLAENINGCGRRNAPTSKDWSEFASTTSHSPSSRFCWLYSTACLFPGRADSTAQLYRVAPVEVHRLTSRTAERAPAGKLQTREKAHMLAKGTEKTEADGRINAEQP